MRTRGVVLWAVVSFALLTGVGVAIRASPDWARREVTHDPSASEPGGGPYRGGRLHGWRSYGAPLVVRIGAGANVAWALLTLSLVVPLAAAAHIALLAGAPGVRSAVLALVSLGLGFDAVLLAFGLLWAGITLVRARSPRARDARTVARWSLGHHTAVAAYAVALLSIRDVGGLLGSAALVVGGVGALLAIALQRSADRAR